MYFNFQSPDTLFHALRKSLPMKADFLPHLSKERSILLTGNFTDLVELVNIVDSIIRKRQDDGYYIVPRSWTAFNNLTVGKRKVMTRYEIDEEIFESLEKEDPESLHKVFEYYQDMRHIIYFKRDKKPDKVILDKEWLLSIFERIYSSSVETAKYFKSNEDVDVFKNTGQLSENIVSTVLDEFDECHENRDVVLHCLHKLGLVVSGVHGKEKNLQCYLVPSINKRQFSNEMIRNQGGNDFPETSILMFDFPFIPHFFFPHLALACLNVWKSPRQDSVPSIYENAIVLNTTDLSYRIMIGICKTTIQLQLYRRNKYDINSKVTFKIRQTFEDILKNVMKDFNINPYQLGYSCNKTTEHFIVENDENKFILEENMKPHRKDGQMPCIEHANSEHFIDVFTILRDWIPVGIFSLHYYLLSYL